MTQYFYVDESGDAGLEGQASSSSHFVMAMTQLPERARLKPIVDLRKALRVSPDFEFKYHKSTPTQKERFFRDVLKIAFRVRAVVVSSWLTWRRAQYGFMQLVHPAGTIRPFSRVLLTYGRFRE